MNRRVLLAGALMAALGAATLPSGAVSGYDPGASTRVSLSISGGQGNRGSGAVGSRCEMRPAPSIVLCVPDPRNDPQPTMSASGRWVAFTSMATNFTDRPVGLQKTDSGEITDVYLRDRDPDADGVMDQGGSVTTRRISVTSSGGFPNHDSFWPSISANGRFVAYLSAASNMIPGYTAACASSPADSVATLKPLCLVNAFLHDRDTDADGFYDEVGAVSTVLVSRGSDGQPLRAKDPCVAGPPIFCDLYQFGAMAPSVSNDGRWVAFASPVRATAGENDGNDSCGPNELDPHTDKGHADACTDVYLRDMTAGTTTLISRAADGTKGIDASVARFPFPASHAPAMTPDGRLIAFASYANNLAPNDTNEAPDVFVVNRDPDGDGVLDEDGDLTFDEIGEFAVERIVPPGRASGRYKSFNPSITPDGAWVAFQAVGSNLYAMGLEPDLESLIVVNQRSTGVNAILTPSGLGNRGELRNYAPSISQSGRFVTFTRALGVSTQFNDLGDVYHELCTQLGRRTFGVPRESDCGGVDVMIHDRDVDADGVYDEADLGTTSTIRVSHGGQGFLEPADGDSYGGTVTESFVPSSSGPAPVQWIAFISYASNLQSGDFIFGGSDNNGVGDVYVHRRGIGICIEIACVY